MKKAWWWNINTHKEKYFENEENDDEWVKGRLPYEYWSEERKQSYSEKRKNIKWSDEYRNKQKMKSRKWMTNMVGYTDGNKNIWLRIGQEVPDGFYRGWTVDDPTKYWRTEKKIQWLTEQLMEGAMSQRQ